MTPYALMESPPGPETVIDGVPYLYFGGTGYLGLAAHAEVVEAGCAALRRYGVHSATTRARFGTSPPVLEVERRAAEYFGTEDAFYFGSGYLSNHVVARLLAPEAEAILVDEAAHYSVVEAAHATARPVLVFRHRDPEDLARRLGNRQRVLAMADAVGPCTGLLAPIADYLRVLDRCTQAHLLLDDAHGFGVLGEHGRGLVEEVGEWPSANGNSRHGRTRLLVCGTLSKALGGYGGILPGTADLVTRARTASHYFDGASAPASAEAGATAKALEIARREPSLRARLRENTLRLRTALRGLGLSVPEGATAQFGVRVGGAEEMQHLHQRLRARGILLPYIGAYAGIPPEGLLRFAVFANHTAAQLDRLVAELRVLL